MSDAHAQVEYFQERFPKIADRIEANECPVCHSSRGILCKTPSDKIAFYHVPRVRLSGCYDKRGNMLPEEDWTPDLLNHYWDLRTIAGRRNIEGVYSDFEGFADTKKVVAILYNDQVNDVLCGMFDLPYDFMRDMLLHYAYENLDQAGHEITVDEAVTFLYTLGSIFASRYWMKVTESDLEDARGANKDM